LFWVLLVSLFLSPYTCPLQFLFAIVKGLKRNVIFASVYRIARKKISVLDLCNFTPAEEKLAARKTYLSSTAAFLFSRHKR
jgi:hypothetical protein